VKIKVTCCESYFTAIRVPIHVPEEAEKNIERYSCHSDDLSKGRGVARCRKKYFVDTRMQKKEL
jgi:hypothetical protein